MDPKNPPVPDPEETKPQVAPAPKKPRTPEEEVPWWALQGVLLVGVLLLAAYAVSADDASAAVFAVEAAIALTALVAGALFGFLFGIPRTPQARKAEGASSATERGFYEPSNNLEQVSDWLTKILVGAGLVQLEELRETLSLIGWRVATAVGGKATAAVTQLTLLVFGIIGFLAGFLWTRVYYGRIQVAADESIRSMLGAVQEAVGEVKQTADAAKEIASASKEIASASAKAMQSQVRDTVDTPAGVAHAMDPDVAAKIDTIRNEPAVWDSDPIRVHFPDAASSANGRTLSAALLTELDGSVIVSLKLAADPDKKLDGEVTFLLHPTLPRHVQTVQARNNAAETTFYSEGWFHAGAVCDNGQTVLKLDLRTVPGIPQWYKEG